MATTLGVPTIEYLPYCFLSFFSIAFALFYAYTGIKILKITDEQASAMATERSIVLDEEPLKSEYEVMARAFCF